MLNKFEGNDPAHFACGVDAFENFDLVASGARDIGRHAGPPWYDGLVYETIRGSPTCWHNVPTRRSKPV